MPVLTSSDEKLAPLVALCRAGRLLDVQTWIRDGKPIALAPRAHLRSLARYPLAVAMERGFHSLVQVLLEAGAPYDDEHYDALADAVQLRRPDLADWLILHGADVHSVSMQLVLQHWRRDMVELFLKHGASLMRDDPIAFGLFEKSRPTLGLLKRFAHDQPELMLQANIALRFHSRHRSPKWVALILWVGADPWARGPEDLEFVDDEGFLGSSAIEIAVQHGDTRVLKLKAVQAALRQRAADATELLSYACWNANAEVLAILLSCGYSPLREPSLGTSLIESLLFGMVEDSTSLESGLRRSELCSGAADDRMKMLGLFVKHGARWLPEDNRAVANTRRKLVCLHRRYTVDFVTHLHEHCAAHRSDVEELLRTAGMQRLLGSERKAVAGLAARLPGCTGRQ